MSDELDLKLALLLSVPCPECNPEDMDTGPGWSECARCQGTGLLWPLRRECTCIGLLSGAVGGVSNAPCNECMDHEVRTGVRRAVHSATCLRCGGRGWEPVEPHLEDLLWLWVERDCDPWSFISLFAEHLHSPPAAILEAAERALLKALAKP